MSKKRICGQRLSYYWYTVCRSHSLSLFFRLCSSVVGRPDLIRFKIKTLLEICQKVYIPPILNLKNCIATSGVLTTAIYVKPELKPAKHAGKYFPSCFPAKHEKHQLLRALVDVVWQCSSVEPQKALAKLTLVYV